MTTTKTTTKTKNMTKRGILKLIKEIAPPPGFTKTITEIPKDNWQMGYTVVELAKDEPNDRIKIKMDFYLDTKVKSSWDTVASGHTTFSSAQGDRSFDRLGVEDSFYVNGDSTIQSVTEKINEQIERIKTSRQRLAQSESIPGLPFLVTPETKASITAKLSSGKSHSFMPSGFGTGYRISKRGGRWAKRCSSETEKFFGVSPLFYETMDCD